MKPIMILKETSTAYIASVNDLSVNISKDSVIIENGIQLHPRLIAIAEVAKLANISDWTLFNM